MEAKIIIADDHSMVREGLTQLGRLFGNSSKEDASNTIIRY